MGAGSKVRLRLPNAIGALDMRVVVRVSAPHPFQAVRSGIVPITTTSNRPAEEAVCSTRLHRR